VVNSVPNTHDSLPFSRQHESGNPGNGKELKMKSLVCCVVSLAVWLLRTSLCNGDNGDAAGFRSAGRIPKPLFGFKHVDDDFQVLKTSVTSLKDKASRRLEKYSPKSVLNYFRTDIGYSSNKIEGNTLTKQEVLTLLQTDLASGTKKLRDYLEVKCHDNAYTAITALSKSKDLIVDIDFIMKLHKICLAPPLDPADPVPGEFKTDPNMVQACHPRTGEICFVDFVKPENVLEELETALEWCKKNEGSCDMIEFITVLHFSFIRIHPFEDSNGRTVRLLINLFLMRNGYPPVSIDPDDRKEYLLALTLADLEDDLLPLAKFLGRSMEKTYAAALEAFS
jgi:Fic family protein